MARGRFEPSHVATPFLLGNGGAHDVARAEIVPLELDRFY